MLQCCVRLTVVCRRRLYGMYCGYRAKEQYRAKVTINSL